MIFQNKRALIYLSIHAFIHAFILTILLYTIYVSIYSLFQLLTKTERFSGGFLVSSFPGTMLAFLLIHSSIHSFPYSFIQFHWLKDGEMFWSVSTFPGSMLVSSISSMDMDNRGQYVKLIPSLTGQLCCCFIFLPPGALASWKIKRLSKRSVYKKCRPTCFKFLPDQPESLKMLCNFVHEFMCK